MRHCRRITVRKAEVDPDQEAMDDFLLVTIFRIGVAAVAVLKSVF